MRTMKPACLRQTMKHPPVTMRPDNNMVHGFFQRLNSSRRLRCGENGSVLTTSKSTSTEHSSSRARNAKRIIASGETSRKMVCYTFGVTGLLDWYPCHRAPSSLIRERVKDLQRRRNPQAMVHIFAVKCTAPCAQCCRHNKRIPVGK